MPGWNDDSANARFKRGGRRRVLAGVVLGAALFALIALLGPSRETVRRRFEFSGAEGPLRLMPELSIERDGRDRVRQEPKRFRNLLPPPPPESFEPPSARGEPAPPPSPRPAPPREELSDQQVADDPDLDLVDQVELNLPRQTNPWFVLERMVRPQYPLGADAQARRQPLVTVEVAFYVNEAGRVTASYILRSDGGPLFDDVVLKAVNAWLYRPLAASGLAPEGFWVRLTVRFRSPYFRR